MATLAQRGSGTPVTTNTTWATPANAVDGAAGSNPATYAVWTNATSGGVATIEITGYNFAAIGASDTLNSVTVSVRNLCSSTGRFSKVEYQAWSGGVALGTIRTGTLATSAHNDSGTFPCTVAQLQAADFKVRITITRAAVTQSATFSIDYADVTADYTAPPPAITQAAYGFFLDTANGERSSPALGRPFTQSTPITRTVAADLNFYLRVRMQSTSADNVPATDDFTLQYEKNASGTWVNATTGGDIVGYLSANLVEGTTVTTERLQNSTADGHDTPGQAWQVNFGGTFRDYGQAFIGDGNTLTGVSLPMRNQSGATGTATFGIYSHNGTYGALNSTPGTLLASATLDVTTIPTGAVTYLMHIPFTGGNQIVLGAGTPYFLTCNFTGSPEISWIATNGPEAVHPGIAIQKYPPVTGSWSAFGQGAYDMIFTIFTNTNPGSGSFVPGKVAEDGVVDDMGWTGGNRTELLYSLRLVYSLLTADSTYRFRVLKNGATTDMTYTVTPTLNAVKPKVGTATTTWAYTALTTWLSPVATMARGVQPPAFSTAGLVSWFDGDATGSIIQTGATAPKIYGMRDRAGINDQGQSTTNNQPLRQPDLIKAGRSSFYNPADAIARYVNGPTLDSIPAPMNVNQWPFTVIVVLKHDGMAQERSIWSVDQTGGLYWTMLADHRMRLDRQSNGSFLYSSALPANTPLILAATLSSGSEARFYVNGVLDASATVSYPFNAANIARLRFGRGVVSYGDNNGVAWGEALKWDRVLSDAERQAVESYLADKWTVLPPAPKLWLDAADASTVALSGSTVTQWSDKSGGARHYTGGNAQYTGSIAGQTTVVVSGPAGAMTGPVITTAVDNFAIFIVCRRTGGVMNSVPFFNGVGATNGVGPAVRAGAANTYGFLRGALAWHESTTADDGQLHVHTLTRSTAFGHFVDGVATSLNGAVTAAPLAATVGSYIPASVVGHDFAGDICEIIYYDRALTIAERQKVENYLLGKWFKKAGSATTSWSANPVAVGKEPAKGSAPTTWIMACAASGTKPEVVGPNEGAGIVSWSMSTLGEVAASAPVYTDTFNRADSSSLGTGWTSADAFWGISGGRAAKLQGGNDFATFNQNLGTSDSWVEAIITNDANFTCLDIRCRAPGDAPGGVNAYLGFWDPSGWFALGKNFNGTWGGQFATTTGVAHPALPYKLRLQAQGSTISLWVNDVSVLSVTDTDIPTGTYVGMNAGNSGTAHVLDNFRAGALPYVAAPTFHYDFSDAASRTMSGANCTAISSQAGLGPTLPYNGSDVSEIVATSPMGRECVHIDGTTGDVGYSETLPASFTSSLITLCAVYKFQSPREWARVVSLGPVGSQDWQDSGSVMFGRDNGRIPSINKGNGGGSQSFVFPDVSYEDMWTVATYTVGPAGAVTIRVNGSVVKTGTLDMGTGVLAARLGIGGQAQGGNTGDAFVGDIGEIKLWDSVLNSTAIAEQESLLTGRWITPVAGGGGAVGKETPKGSGTTAWTTACAAVGKRAPKAAPVVAYTYNPVAVGKRSPKGAAATGNYTEATAANGKRTPKATANVGNWTEAVTSVGKRTPKSTVITAWVEATAAVGYRMSKGSAPSGNFLETLVVVGKRTPKGTITVSHSWVTAAVGAKPVVGQKQGAGTTSYSFNPTAVGKRAPKATATTAYVEVLAAAGKKIQKSSVGLIWIAATSAAGKRAPKATATTTTLQTVGATGKRTPVGAAVTSFFIYNLTAQGVKPVVGVKQGSGIAINLFNPAAAGKRTPKGGNTTTWTNVCAAVGKKAQKGVAGAISYIEAVVSVGKRVPKSAPSTTYVEATAAAGKKAPKGTSNVGNHSWTLTAQGSSPLVGYNKGSGLITNAFATTAVGRRVPKGSRTISNTFNPVATGKKLQKATVTTSFHWQASAAGKKFSSSTVVFTHAWVLSGVGYEVPKARGDTDYWFSQVALGLQGITGTVEGIWNGQEVVAMQYGDKPVIEWLMLPA
jgi:hypothetical protein